MLKRIILFLILNFWKVLKVKTLFLELYLIWLVIATSFKPSYITL